MFAILRQKNFTLLWCGQMISVIGDWVLIIALPFYIYTISGSALATGGMFIAMTLPRLILGLLAGVFVDRWDRRWTMISADVVRMLLLLVLLFARSVEQLWLIYAVAMIEAAVSQFFVPAKIALIPHLVGDNDLSVANSLDSFSDALTRLIGPSLGGALFGLMGIFSIIWLDSASYLFSALMILLISIPRRPTNKQPVVAVKHPTIMMALRKVWQELLEGLQVIQNDRVLSVLFASTGIMMISQGIIEVLLVIYAKQVLHGGAPVMGILMTAQGIGTLIGALMMGNINKRFLPRPIMLASFLLAGILLIIMVNVPLLIFNIALTTIIGITMVMFFVTGQTLMQGRVADEYRGRVFSSFTTTVALLTLVGMGLASLLEGMLNVVQLMDIAGMLFILGALIVLMMPPTGLHLTEQVTLPLPRQKRNLA